MHVAVFDLAARALHECTVVGRQVRLQFEADAAIGHAGRWLHEPGLAVSALSRWCGRDEKFVEGQIKRVLQARTGKHRTIPSSVVRTLMWRLGLDASNERHFAEWCLRRGRTQERQHAQPETLKGTNEMKTEQVALRLSPDLLKQIRTFASTIYLQRLRTGDPDATATDAAAMRYLITRGLDAESEATKRDKPAAPKPGKTAARKPAARKQGKR